MIVIFGGTGTLGNAIAKELNGQDVTIVSRCELKQKQMAEKFPRFNYVLGDIRDKHWQSKIKIDHASYVFNLAAVKHVELAEANVEYCFDVNVNGTKNTLDWAIEKGAQYLFSSTDKAVLPINAYGASKMMAEKLVLEKGHLVFRWGNVLGSRGSVLGSFKKSLLEHKKVCLTHEDMTRFWVLIEDVAKFMVTSMGEKTGVYIPEMGSAPVKSVVHCLAEHLGVTDYKTEITGIRAGEKIHECLWTSHDVCMRSDDINLFYPKSELMNLISKACNDC